RAPHSGPTVTDPRNFERKEKAALIESILMRCSSCAAAGPAPAALASSEAAAPWGYPPPGQDSEQLRSRPRTWPAHGAMLQRKTATLNTAVSSLRERDHGRCSSLPAGLLCMHGPTSEPILLRRVSARCGVCARHC